jgi:hypothetical protein
MRRRHYHVEDIDGSISAPITSFRKAISEAFKYVQHARLTGTWDRWRVDWHDAKYGTHRWEGVIKDDRHPSRWYYDYITVLSCTDSCLKKEA